MSIETKRPLLRAMVLIYWVAVFAMFSAKSNILTFLLVCSAIELIILFIRIIKETYEL